MREILFRGKGLYKDFWYYGYYVEHKRSMMYYIIDLDETVMNTQHLINKDTLGQYTGLKDKNGTKIFEGDIFKGITEDTDQGRYGVIKYGKYKDENFEDSCLGFYFEFGGEQFSIFNGEAQGYDLPSLVEVVGNIYDNPELLEDDNA